MYAITWMEVDCPGCQNKNWVRLGNIADQTVSDATHFSCWYCQQQTAMADDSDDLDEPERDITPGLEKPE